MRGEEQISLEDAIAARSAGGAVRGGTKRKTGDKATSRGGEEKAITCLDDLRKIPKGLFVEFQNHEMGALGALCREYDVEDLFKTCMKIYK